MSACGALPAVGETASQEESLPALKLSDPDPVLDTDRLAAGGFAPPTVAPMLKEVGVTDKVGPVAARLA